MAIALLALAPLAFRAALVLPFRGVDRHAICMSADPRLAQLQETLAGLVADGYDDAVLEPLRAQIADIEGVVRPTAPSPAPPPTRSGVESAIRNAMKPKPPPPPPPARTSYEGISFEEALRIAREKDAQVDWGEPPTGATREEAEKTREAQDRAEEKAREAKRAAAAAREAVEAKARARLADGRAVEKREAEAATAEAAKQRGLEAATAELDSAMRGVDYGARACTEGELQRLRDAVTAARDAGMPPADVTRADQIAQAASQASVAEARAAVERAEAERAAAAKAAEERAAAERAEAERAAKAKAAEEAARAAAERAAAERAAAAKAAEEQAKAEAAALARAKAEVKAEIQRSVRLSGKPRIELLRSLQVEWHPDRYREKGDAAQEVAQEVSMMINEAMSIARKNEKDRGNKGRL